MESVVPPKKTSFTPFGVKRQVNFDMPKTTTPTANTAPNQAIIQEARQKGVCWRCKEVWSPGHKQVCKLTQKNMIQALQATTTENPELIYIIESEEDLVEFQKQQEDEVLQLSMHAVMGKGTSKTTFTVNVKIGNIMATALIDSGSSSTFISSELAAKLPEKPVTSKKMKVQVANGGVLWSQHTCYNCNYSIQGEPFTRDFKVLQLSGYDIILGADWLKQFSPIELDFIQMIMRITKSKGHKVTFKDETMPSLATIKETSNLVKLLEQADCGIFLMVSACSTEKEEPTVAVPPIIQHLIEEYADIFAEPTELPPSRHCDHAIPLQPGAKIVNQSPYRLPHHQKDALEEIIKKLIATGII
ncbi:uncharacterized protein [Aegilops tauschii subsp. strangulata]|uniref:uncharacterized protein n=1 Tax=Aegilops tauschii subsp. strangulata TaxID=200361 RepID=UPI003CC872D7